jgi:hypothetical protein
MEASLLVMFKEWTWTCLWHISSQLDKLYSEIIWRYFMDQWDQDNKLCTTSWQVLFERTLWTFSNVFSYKENDSCTFVSTQWILMDKKKNQLLFSALQSYLDEQETSFLSNQRTTKYWRTIWERSQLWQRFAHSLKIFNQLSPGVIIWI